MPDKKKDETKMNEATSAASSLKPGGGSGDGTQKWTRSEVMQKIASKVANMSMEDLSAFLVKTLDQVGKEDDKVADTSGRNKSSIAGKGPGKPDPLADAKKGMKEDVKEIFGEDENLSEEFKESASALFEAAVSTRVHIIQEKLEEAYEEKLDKELAEEVDTLHEKVNEYLDYVVEKWMEENKIAIESNVRSQIAENFLSGLKTLFSESYVEVPEDKVDLVNELANKVEELESKLDETTAENMKLTKIVEEAELDVIFDEVSEGLADTQVEKLRNISENLDYDNVEEFKEKLETIKEQYFTNKKKTSGGLLKEEADGRDPEDNRDIVEELDDTMKRYVNSISSTAGRFKKKEG